MNKLEEPRPPNCIYCEYMRVCDDDRGSGQKIDYCPDDKYREWLSKEFMEKTMREKIGKELLTNEEIDAIEWESGTLDMSFVDDYREEVKALLQAQLDKVLKALES